MSGTVDYTEIKDKKIGYISTFQELKLENYTYKQIITI